MRIGVSFPQREKSFGVNVETIRRYVRALEEMEYDHLRIGEHVLGANSTNRPGWSGPYDHTALWHEPFVFFGFLAALTETLELLTGILILPQRQTALVAKQAAEVDVLSRGRLRLGVGIGWNEVEYEALGENFRNRGLRCAEQIEVMRALWTNKLVTFDGQWHKITDAGLNPMPIQRPIPIWIGGGKGSPDGSNHRYSDRVLKRIAMVADGWLPSLGPETGIQEVLSRIHHHMIAINRDPLSLGIEGLVQLSEIHIDGWIKHVRAWKAVGATHISIDTSGCGFSSLDQHIDLLKQFKETVKQELM